MPVSSRLKHNIKTFSCKHLCICTFNLHLKFGVILSEIYKDMTLYPHMYQKRVCNLLQKNFSIQEWPLYKRQSLEMYSEWFFMFGTILNATNSSFQKSMTFCRSIYVKKVMELLAFIFEQPS